MTSGNNFLEAFDGLLELDIFASKTGEGLGNKKWLGKESLNFSCSGNNQLVFVAQFDHTKNGDDVLKILVTLQNLFDSLCRIVVIVADNVRIKNS